jgi:hypothetical protein
MYNGWGMRGILRGYWWGRQKEGDHYDDQDVVG